MNDELLQIYNDELLTLRKKGAAFAERNPKVAGRLKLSQGSIEDPLVGRLMESFAFLTASLRYQMRAEIDSLHQNLTQLLYPHYFLPLPAYTTVQLQPRKSLDCVSEIPAKTRIKTSLPNGDICRFSLVYPIAVNPLKLSSIIYQREGKIATKKNPPKTLKSCLSFCLETIDSRLILTKAIGENLRIYVNVEPHFTGVLQEILSIRLKEVIVSYKNAEKTVDIPIENVNLVGFADDEALLPYPSNTFLGYRLLTEYFAYPDKFLYVDILNINQFIPEEALNAVNIHLFFNEYHPDLEKIIDDNALKLNCGPAINLYTMEGEPIKFDQKQREYHVIADASYHHANLEIYTIEAIRANHIHDKIDCAPYFGRVHHQKQSNFIYWHQQRKTCAMLGKNNVPGDEVFISLSDDNMVALEEQIILTPTLLCTNRDAPAQLPFGGGKPTWAFDQEQYTEIAMIHSFKPILSTKYRSREHIEAGLAKHIYINQMGYVNHKHTLETLKAILTLYRFGEEHSHHLIDSGIIAAEAKLITVRHPDSLHYGFCRGICYTITVDEAYFPKKDTYLFGCVLQNFLSKSCSMNTFVRLTLKSQQRGVINQWKPLLGAKPIL